MRNKNDRIIYYLFFATNNSLGRGYQVSDPVAVAQWYSENLGFTIKRASESKARTHFLADAAGQVMIEIYCNPQLEVPDYKNMEPLIWHLAFTCKNVPETIQSLEAAGATIANPLVTTSLGDKLVMLRDPWGMCIQLCQRAAPML